MIDLDNLGQVREAAQAAYMAGNVELSNAYEALADSLALVDTVENYDEYKQFFYDCFKRLAGEYYDPMVISEIDKGVIFETIEKGAGL